MFAQASRYCNTVPADSARSSRAHHNFASAVSLNDEVCQASENKVVNRATSRQNASEDLGNTKCVDEDVAHVIAGDVDPTDLIHGLHPRSQDHTTKNASRPTTGDQLPPSESIKVLPIENILDDCKLCLD